MKQGDIFAVNEPEKQVALKRPMDQLHDLLMGHLKWDDAQDGIRSAASYYIHEAAIEILDLADKPARQMTLSRMPDHIRPRVEAEMLRVWKIAK